MGASLIDKRDGGINQYPGNVEVKTVKAVLKALGVSFKEKGKNGIAKKADKEQTYNPEYVAMIQESQKQYEEGRYKVIKTEDLWSRRITDEHRMIYSVEGTLLVIHALKGHYA